MSRESSFGEALASLQRRIIADVLTFQFFDHRHFRDTRTITPSVKIKRRVASLSLGLSNN